MENINPALNLAYHIKRNMKAGRATSLTLKDYIEANTDEVSLHLLTLYSAWQNNTDYKREEKSLSIYIEALFDLIFYALKGQSIEKSLDAWIHTYEKQVEVEVDAFVAKLPFKLLLPLLGLQFPAFFVLLFGPILEKLTEAM